MPHIHIEPGGHDATVSAYIFRTDGVEPQALLHQHKLFKKWMQFGGHVEIKENPWQAMCHEILEESGYEISQLKVLQPKVRIIKLTRANLHPLPFAKNTHSFPNNHYHSDDAYLFVASEAPKHKPADGEMTDIKLFTRDELASLTEDEILKNVQEIFLAAFDLFLGEWEALPAADFNLPTM